MSDVEKVTKSSGVRFLISKIKEYNYSILSFPGGLKTRHKYKNRSSGMTTYIYILIIL